MADRIIGVSNVALSAFSDAKSRGGKYHVVHCGFDLLPFAVRNSSSDFKINELGVPSDAKIMLFVGRMIPYKNPSFVMEILKQLSHSGLNVYAVFAGDGPMISQVTETAKKMNLLRQVRLLGKRDDVPLLMQSSDILICPSVEVPKEGLGLVIVEAQAAGLPVLMSKSIPEEAVVISDLITILPLSVGRDAWSSAVTEIFGRNSRYERMHCLEIMRTSSFSISSSFCNIRKIYI